jgi:hypothetical protein
MLPVGGVLRASWSRSRRDPRPESALDRYEARRRHRPAWRAARPVPGAPRGSPRAGASTIARSPPRPPGAVPRGVARGRCRRVRNDAPQERADAFACRGRPVELGRERRSDSSATLVPQHDEEGRPEVGARILDAPQHLGRHDVAGHADDEEVAEPLIEQELRWNARIAAPEDRRERLLARDHLRQCRASRPTPEPLAGGEPPVPCHEAPERLGASRRGRPASRLPSHQWGPNRRGAARPLRQPQDA